jgi:PDZ domain
MFRVTCVFLLLATAGSAQNTPRVYYENGDTMEQISDNGLTLTVTLRDTGKENWLWVYIQNLSNDAVNLIPSNITLHQDSPKDEELRMKSERETLKSIGHHVFWGQVVAGVGAGLSRSVSTIKTTDSHGNSVKTVVNTPDYEAQARWLAYADQKVQQGQALTDFHQRQWLRANTLFAGSEYAGRLIFVRDKTLASGYAKIAFDDKTYEFPFPPPKDARPPQSPPSLPSVGIVKTAHASSAPGEQAQTSDPAIQATEQSPVPSQPHPAGVLGISGANWQQADSMGVEIVGVAPDSAAQLAGLHRGNVIMKVNGRPIHSTQELAAALSENGPGARITIVYLVNTNLGWMPEETAAILAGMN